MSTHRSLVAFTLSILVALAAVIGPAAQAATTGLSAELLLGTTRYDGVPVVEEGQTLTLKVQYDDTVTPGSTAVFEVGPNVTLTGVPAGNSAIESVTKDGNTVSITFRDPWPSDVNQGVFDLKFTVNPVDQSTKEPLTWKLDGDQSSVDVIVKNSGDTFANVANTAAKGVNPTNLDSYVGVSNGQVVLDPAIAGRELTYTLTMNSPDARTDYPITDQLPAGLGYVAGSFAGQLTSWDEAGLNQTTTSFDYAPTITGTSFAGPVSVPGPSVLRLTYKATVTDIAALRAQLQTKYDALGGDSGAYEISLKNTATFGQTEKSASIRVGGRVAGVDVGSAFGKTAEWGSKNVKTASDGTLTPPADLTYTLKADLRKWTGGPNFTLNRNVVISDELPAQASWQTADPQFITASGITLTAATTCPDASAFADDAFVGQYCVDGQRLLVNVGRDTTTNASIAVKAQVTSVAGLDRAGSTTVADAVPYRLRNVATFAYRDGEPYAATRDVTVVALPSSVRGINDSSVFTKTGAAEQAAVDPGDSVTMRYTFTVAAGKGVDARTSRIVDAIDTTIFDPTDPTALAVTGAYDGQSLSAADFALSTDEAGRLTIELSSTGRTIVDARGADKKYVVNLALTSKPFEGKVTKTITNEAILLGENDTPLYWSRTSAEATSYGDEAEVRKRVYDGSAKTWAESVRAPMDGSGALVDSRFAYRVEFLPHGSYDNVTVVPVKDVLPSGLEFLGFVTESDVTDDDPATGASPATGPVDIGGNLVASYDPATRTVTLAQKAGTKLDAGTSIAAYFAVRVSDASAPIVNRIGTTAATIVPVPSVSVGDYVWVDADRDGRQDDGEPGIGGVTLRITGPDDQPVTDVFGRPVGPVVTDENGAYTFADLPVLTGDQTYTVTIDRSASADALKPYVPTRSGEGDRAGDSSTWSAASQPGSLAEDGDRDPTLDFGFVTKTYAIGDVVWIDTDRDGSQDPGEKPLPGVTVDLVDAQGAPVATTSTDEAGRYVFDNLAAGTYRVRFTLTDEQQKTYGFTGRDAGTDSDDSDADPADGMTITVVLDDANAALTRDYSARQIDATEGIDPTWDAGVVIKPVPAATSIDVGTDDVVSDDVESVPDDAVAGDDESTADGELADTGNPASLTALLAALLAVGCGGLLVRFGRRRP